MRRIRNRNIKKNQILNKYMILILTVVCILGIFGGLILNIKSGPLKSIAGYLFVPMQQGINITGTWLFDKVNDFKTLTEVLEENEKLKKQNEELTNQITIAKIEQYELENLRKLFQLSEKYPTYEKVAANVIGKDSGNWFSTFIINRGSINGIEVGMNVIAGNGLVGIVTDVGPNYAKVRSIIDDLNNVSAMVTSTGDNFNVSGNLKTMNESMTITFSGLRDSENKVKVGDPVITSYVSDQYHQGILIGYISSIENGPNKLTKIGTITPVADFEHIEEVLVIKKLKNSETESTTEQPK